MDKNDLIKKEKKKVYIRLFSRIASILLAIAFIIYFIVFSPVFFAIPIFGIFILIDLIEIKKDKKLLEELGGMSNEEIEVVKAAFKAKEDKKRKRIVIAVVALVILGVIYGIVDSGSGSKKHSENNNKENGFVGSDGKYHPYIPEFGDDVNNWMKDNW